LHCGKPLGSRTALCYGCESDGIAVEDVLEVDDEVRERVKRYFIVASVRCAECGGLHGTVTVDGESYTAADFGIDSEAAWEREMEKEEDWLRAHKSAVAHALVALEDEWPESVAATRERLS
jgi:hypothetical protein